MNRKSCRHCGAALRYYPSAIHYCPECGGLLEIPERREVNPVQYLKKFGTLAYCLPDLSLSEWRTIEGSERYAREIYREDERVSLKAAFAMLAIPDREYETLFLNKGYEVVARLKDGYATRMSRSDQECGSKIDMYDESWVLDCDIEMEGYIANDRNKRTWRLRIPGTVWDQFAVSVKDSELPIDSEIVFMCHSCIGGEFECSEATEVSDLIPGTDRICRKANDLLWVRSFKKVRDGSETAQRELLLTRVQICSIRTKLAEEELAKWRNVKV